MALAPTESVTQIEITDLRSCDRWLERAPLADPQQAIEALRAVVATIGNRRLGPRVHLDILERLRDPAMSTCEERIKRFAGRALPLREGEAEALTQVVGLLQEFWSGYYTLLIDAAQHGLGVLDRKLHLLAGRCLEAGCETAVAYYRARHEVPPGVWKDLHEVFGLAEQRQFALEPLPGEGNRPGPTCKSLYVGALLLQTARPYGLSAREIELARRWMRGWADHVELQQVTETRDALIVDLQSDLPPSHRSVTGDAMQPGWRAVEQVDLKRSVRKRIAALRRGATCAELGLGRDCRPREAEALLVHLFNAWFSPPNVRQFQRRTVRQDVELIVGFEAIHAHELVQPTDAVIAGGDELIGGGVAEKWRLLEDSPAGFRVRRPEGGGRLNHLQLVAIRPPGSAQYILTETRWLMLDQRNSMSAGLQALRGLARAAFARVSTLEADTDEPDKRVFILAESKGNASLVVPPGGFLEGCFIELLDGDRRQRVRITEITRRGADYECVAFEALL